MKIPARLRTEVIRRAHGRCEYCMISQAGQEAAFHVDHIHPQAYGGLTELQKPCAGLCLVFAPQRGATDGK